MTEPDESIFPYFSYSGDLSECFMWGRTSEGYDYWYSIFDCLEPDEDIEKEDE